MAQNITLLGANYPSVPGVQLPKTGGGTALFTDVTPTTASAADVAQGKIFFDASGSQQTGTASGGGGGGSPKKFVMRPDAELVRTYSADYFVVADRGLTLPSYSTSSQTIVASETLSPNVTVDSTNYDYFVTMRGLSIPQYNTTTKQKGRCDYTVTSYVYEPIVIPANDMHTIDGTKSYDVKNTMILNHNYTGRLLYWTSATAISTSSSASYGAYATGVAPSFGQTLTVKSPTCGIRGNTSYMTSAAWATMTDIRYQWIIEVWRAPSTEVIGWEHTNAIRSILADVRNGGTLT